MQPPVLSPACTPRASDFPFIVAQLGQSLDGRIATPSGESRGIGGAASLRHLHALRAAVDAVVVGQRTVQIDNPRLTVRLCEGRSPARVVIDAAGALDPAALCLDGSDGARRLVLRGEGVSTLPLPTGVEVVTLPRDGSGRFDLVAVARALRRQGFGRVLIEGGATLVSRSLDAGIVDRLHLLVSPVILGAGLNGLNLLPPARLNEALRPHAEVIPLGQGEVLFDCDLRKNGANQKNGANHA